MNNEEEIKKLKKSEYLKAWKLNNPEKVKAIQRKSYLKNSKHICAKSKKYYHEHSEYINARKRKRRKKVYKPAKNEEILKAEKFFYHKKYREDHKDDALKYQREYRKKNSDKIRKYFREYNKKRIKNDITFKIIKNLRWRLNSIYKAKNFEKSKKSLDIIGCTPDFLRDFLAKRFKVGMTHENNSPKGWHIDHIIPLASAGTDIEKAEKLCHYTNLQPLWWYENLSKGDKIQ